MSSARWRKPCHLCPCATHTVISQAQEQRCLGERELEWEKQGLEAREHSLWGWHGAERGKMKGNPTIGARLCRTSLHQFAWEKGICRESIKPVNETQDD